MIDLEYADTCSVCGKSHFDTDDDGTYGKHILQIRMKADADALVLQGFDGCIVGATNDGRLVYDIDLIRTVLCNNLGMDALKSDEEMQYLLKDEDIPALKPIFVSLNHELLTYQYSHETKRVPNQSPSN
jgi:hypothetical protein